MGCATCTRCDGRRQRVACCSTWTISTLDVRMTCLVTLAVELQRRTGSASNKLTLQDQDGVAAALGYVDADSLMAAVSEAARTIAWTSDDTWRRIRSSLHGPHGRLAHRDREIRPGVVVRDGEIRVAVDVLDTEPSLPLQVAAAAAEHDVPIAARRAGVAGRARAASAGSVAAPRRARRWSTCCSPAGERFPSSKRSIKSALWVRVLPEWANVRCRPQRNAYHRFTVDRHLVETAANAGERAGGISRPDLLGGRRAVARHREGLPGRSHRSRDRSRTRDRSADGIRPGRHRHPRVPRRKPPAACRRRHPS